MTLVASSNLQVSMYPSPLQLSPPFFRPSQPDHQVQCLVIKECHWHFIVNLSVSAKMFGQSLFFELLQLADWRGSSKLHPGILRTFKVLTLRINIYAEGPLSSDSEVCSDVSELGFTFCQSVWTLNCQVYFHIFQAINYNDSSSLSQALFTKFSFNHLKLTAFYTSVLYWCPNWLILWHWPLKHSLILNLHQDNN